MTAKLYLCEENGLELCFACKTKDDSKWTTCWTAFYKNFLEKDTKTRIKYFMDPAPIKMYYFSFVVRRYYPEYADTLDIILLLK